MIPRLVARVLPRPFALNVAVTAGLRSAFSARQHLVARTFLTTAYVADPAKSSTVAKKATSGRKKPAAKKKATKKAKAKAKPKKKPAARPKAKPVDRLKGPLKCAQSNILQRMRW